MVQIIEDAAGEVHYTVRAKGGRLHPRVHGTGRHTIKVGLDKPDVSVIDRQLCGLVGA